jgi:hypothetical protein
MAFRKILKAIRCFLTHTPYFGLHLQLLAMEVGPK